MNKVALYTLGCRVNQYETEAMAEAFIKKNYRVVDFEAFADVYVINTCTVTNIGDRKSRQMIRKAKKRNPNAIVVVAGCYAQVAPIEISQVDGVDIIVGTTDKGKAAELVEEFRTSGKQINTVENIMSIRKFEELEIDEYQDRTRAFLKVQDGCDRFCSYCLIPYARGPVRSRDPENIVKEVEKLAGNGFREIILSGIHVASYGKDLGNISLVDVVKNINGIDGIERIRIGSVDPAFFSGDIINELLQFNKFCPHFHLSLQSGCTSTLKRMNRHYTASEYEATVAAIRRAFIDASITTDIIVGFPGETDEEFNETYDFLNRIRLSKMHIFKYSPRKGTRAENLGDQVSPEVKESRSKRLIELDKILEREFMNKFLGRSMDVLFEDMQEGFAGGYTRNYIRVNVNTDKDVAGEIHDVKLKEIVDDAIKGFIVG